MVVGASLTVQLKPRQWDFGQFTSTFEVAEKWVKRGGQIATVLSDQALLAGASSETLEDIKKLINEIQN